MRAALPLLLAVCCPLAAAEPSVDRQALAQAIAERHGLAAEQVASTLAEAEFQPAIIEAITRPAEAKPWKDYRPIFMNPRRIADGRAFLAEHRDALARVEAETGVPAELIVAIIGVETNYGRLAGHYRVLDALYTLGTGYPPRQDFFRSELGELFALAAEERIDLAAVKGSYAGAMGWGQFMPSSYRKFAVDGDGDGQRDLWDSPADVFASIAHYFVAHGWQSGQPVVAAAELADGREPFKPDTLEARYHLAELAGLGYRPARAIGHDLPATVLNLDGADGPEYWFGFPNFYVISRYNRSPLYSLAVYQLSQSLVSADVAAAQPTP